MFFSVVFHSISTILYSLYSSTREINVMEDGVDAKVNDTKLLCFQFNHYPLLQIIFSILLYSFIQFEINVIFQSVLYALLLLFSLLFSPLLLYELNWRMDICDQSRREKKIQFSGPESDQRIRNNCKITERIVYHLTLVRDASSTTANIKNWCNFFCSSPIYLNQKNSSSTYMRKEFTWRRSKVSEKLMVWKNFIEWFKWCESSYWLNFSMKLLVCIFALIIMMRNVVDAFFISSLLRNKCAI
jgi:hypothetical protein